MSRATIKADLLRQRAIATLVEPKLTITDEDVRSAYDQLARRSDAIKAVAVAHILFALPPHPTDAQLSAARTRAAAALDRVRAGEDFAALARELSDDAKTKASGGELGWVENGKTAPWDDVIFAMAAGDTRGPVRDAAGLHLLHARDVKIEGIEPFAKLEPSLRKELRQRETAKLVHAWTTELRKQAYIALKL